jgi:hypothetical protein
MSGEGKEYGDERAVRAYLILPKDVLRSIGTSRLSSTLAVVLTRGQSLNT